MVKAGLTRQSEKCFQRSAAGYERVTKGGKLFKTRAAATEKVWSPIE